MGDCPNVEMRELLPARAAEVLTPDELSRVDAHLSSCEMCAFELEILVAARTSMRRGRDIDVRRISAAVAAATHAPRVARVRRTQTWTGWRAAASIALVAVGATSIALYRRGQDAPRAGAVAIVPAVVSTPSAMSPLPTPRGSTSNGGEPAASRGLAVAGGLSDLTDSDLESLLGEIGALDASNVAEPEEIIPAFSGSEGVQ
jgi:hypothetical protein